MRERPQLNILIVDRSVTDAETLADKLRRNGYVVNARRVNDLNECRQQVLSKTFDIDILFIRFDNDQMPLQSFLANGIFEKLNVIVILDEYHRQTAASLVHLGAYDVLASTERELLKTCVERLLLQNQCRKDLETSYRTFNEDNQRLRWLSDHIDQALAYLHQGIFVYTNPAFDDKFGRPIYGETTIFEFVDATEVARLKSVLHNPLLSSIDTPVQVRFTKPRSESLTVMMKNGIYEHEPCVQLLFVREHTISQPNADTVTPKLPHVNTQLNTEDFFDALQDYLSKPELREIRGWLAAIEVDQYQTLKRRAGLSVVKKTLQDLTVYLQQQLGSDGSLVYLGQASFIVFIPNESRDHAIALCEKLIGDVKQKPFQIGKKAVELSLSIGVAALYGNTQNIDAVVSVAENSSGIAQKTGGNKLYVYDPQRDAHLATSQENNWQRRVEEALAYHLFSLTYQPVASLHANAEERYEVLLRLKEKDKEIVPMRFLPAIQQTTLPTKIDKWVIENIANKWQEMKRVNRTPVFFIKIADASIIDNEFLSWLEKTEIIASEIRPYLVFEIEMNAILALEKKAKEFTRRAKELGYKIAIERCGGHQSSLDIVTSFDVAFIKIDGKIIHHLGRDRQQQHTVHAIASAAKKANKLIIAANVQDADSLAVLWQEGIHFIQGFYVQKPGPDLTFDFGN